MYREVGTPRVMQPKPKPAESKPRGLVAGNVDITTVEGTPPKIIEQIKFTPQVIQETLERYEAQIVQAPVEHAIVIAPTGEVYHCNGDVHGIPFDYFARLSDKLNGAHVTHNHPPGAEENENTFSDDDFKRFISFNMARLRGIDEKFIYELNRNPMDNEFYGHDLVEIYTMKNTFEDYHVGIMILAWSNGLGYWRLPR